MPWRNGSGSSTTPYWATAPWTGWPTPATRLSSNYLTLTAMIGLMILAIDTEPEDDAVEHLSGTGALAALRLGRIFFQDDKLDDFPKLVRYSPDGS